MYYMLIYIFIYKHIICESMFVSPTSEVENQQNQTYFCFVIKVSTLHGAAQWCLQGHFVIMRTDLFVFSPPLPSHIQHATNVVEMKEFCCCCCFFYTDILICQHVNHMKINESHCRCVAIRRLISVQWMKQVRFLCEHKNK